MGILVNYRFLCLATLVLLHLPAQAEAAGRLLSRGGTGVQILKARSALARGPTRTTVWYQLQLDGSAEEVLWLLPVPPETAVDVAATSFFDGLEESTAPRVLAPSGTGPKNRICSIPSPQVISSGESGAVLNLLGQEVFSDPDAISPKIKQLGYSLSAAELAELSATMSKGTRLLALRMSAPLGLSSSITLRFHGSSVDLKAMALLRSAAEPIPWNLWMIGASRGKVQGVGELEMEPSSVRWLSPHSSNYGALQEAMLKQSGGASVLLQVAGPNPLHDLTALAGGNDIPPFLDTYLRRVFERGEATGDLGVASDSAHLAVEEDLPDGCPRGDLLPSEGFTCSLPGANDPMVPSAGADDLAFVFAGTAPSCWVSRVAGLLPSQTTAIPISVAFPGGELASVLFPPANVWDGLCSDGSGSQGGGGVWGGGGKNGGTGAGGPVPSGPGTSGPIDHDSIVVEDGPHSENYSCVNVIVDEGCDGGPREDGSSEDCNCDDTSSSQEGLDSEGCSCGDLSSSSEGDSCDGGDSSSGESCSGSEGSGGGDSCGSGPSGGDSCGKDCAMGRPRRRSPRLSKWLFLIAAATLPLRRWRRPRDRKQRKDRVTS